MKAEIRKLRKDGEPRLFKCRIIIGIDTVDANNRAAILREPARGKSRQSLPRPPQSFPQASILTAGLALHRRYTLPKVQHPSQASWHNE